MSADDLTMTTTTDGDPAIRVHVSPSQASYFAGEQFSVTITFTNTRTPESPKIKNAHRRGVHSISSAPLARPPTSPGIPRPTALAPVNHARELPARKRLIGQVPGKIDMSAVLEQKRQTLLEKSRSLSIDIPATDLFPKSSGESADGGASRYVRAYEFSNAGTTTTISPLSRSPDFQLPPHHPHARKQSVADVHIHLNDIQQPSPTATPSSGLTSSSGSTFSLALDPIAETPATPYPGTPLPRSPSLTESLDQRLFKGTPPTYISRLSQPRRPPPQLGLGHGPPPSSSRSIPSLRNGTLVSSNSELILYSYVQLLGTVSITPLTGDVTKAEYTQTLAGLRQKLSRRRVVGGGSMDIASHQQMEERRRTHGRSASFASSLFSLLSPSSYSTPLPSSQSWAPGRSRTPSLSSAPAGEVQQSGVGLGLLDGGAGEEIEADAALPTFDVQPAMLAVDLVLEPGESRTYTYTVTLPENLPPTFRGRVLKFSYELVIGTCRASGGGMRSSSSLGPTGANSTSRVMKVPMRVYNHVAVGKVPRAYDLLWPVGKGTEWKPRVVEGAGKGGIQGPVGQRSDSVEEVRAYGRGLLGMFPGGEAGSPVEGEFEGGMGGCREAVEIVTRNPKKVSYDVNKEGIKVAVLTFTKTAYRLGETVMGVVEVNERDGRSRVMSVSAMLETEERMPSEIGSGPVRRVHGEQHASVVSGMLRTTFSLDIPSDASPAFEVSMGGSGKGGGLAWRVRLSLLVGVAEGSTREMMPVGRAGEWGVGYQAYPTMGPRERGGKKKRSRWMTLLGEEGEEEEEWEPVRLETVECEVPIRVFPGNTPFQAMDVLFDL